MHHPPAERDTMLDDISAADELYIVCGYTAIRRSIDGLYAIVQDRLHMEPGGVGARISIR